MGIWTLARKMTSFRFPENVLCFSVRVRIRVKVGTTYGLFICWHCV